MPFDEETRAYIAALDAEADLATLAEHGLPLRSDCKRVFRAATMCLQLGAAAGLTPYAIGNIMWVQLCQQTWGIWTAAHRRTAGSSN